MRRRVLGYPTSGKLFSASQPNEIAKTRTTLHRLQGQGLVVNDSGLWRITRRGLMYLKNVLPAHTRMLRKQRTEKRMIIAFDIPERYRRKRNWLRLELGVLGFTMLQKSVWFGPAPLPKSFIRSLEELRLIPFMKFFEARESEIV